MIEVPIHYWILRGLLIGVVVVTIGTAVVLVPWKELFLQLDAVVSQWPADLVRRVEEGS